MKLFQSNRRALLVLAVLAVLGVVALVLLAPQFVGWFLAAVALVGVLWIGSFYLVRWLQRRRQQRFDASVAAKEGIDDRRSEWRTWTAELEQQGIDRYELPFYLLVGEPQSGKSVLLQNSDLNFPFGQTRLSGIGGTRGCDWWFTEEAVILDLAGRLFTHEGGASDEAEWEAFLDLLAGYRPLCPADGLMLVIPCDSLLTDSKDEIGRKAGKIRDALLTLTTRLQAQLPIYVVLTKGDRIFGFAETVHRLEAEQRQQMFGWSRDAEAFDAPFDIVEVRRAFDGVVERARGLRDSMMATVRLPEGLGEVDRMYAFPDELAALESGLEAYLKGIFSESRLVDRLFFRGFYLTSGLQTGKPIANVCADLYGSTGEADQRDLEALFTRQHAYFIKDLVRRRVFSERGLVRPTAARVARSRRNALIGYGAAASLALVSTAWCLVYAFTEYDAGVEDLYGQSIQAAAVVADAEEPEVTEVLVALDRVWRAQEIEEPLLEQAATGRSGAFESLYCQLYDRKLMPLVRSVVEAGLQEALDAEDLDHAGFVRCVERAIPLLSGFDTVDPDVLDEFEGLLEAGAFEAAGVGRLRVARERRASLRGVVEPVGSAPAPEGRSAALGSVEVRIADSFPATLVAGDPLQVDGAAGYLVAWRGAERERLHLESLDPATSPLGDLTQHLGALHPALRYLRSAEATEGLSRRGESWRLPRARIDEGLDALTELRARFLAAKDGGPPQEWPARMRLAEFADSNVGGGLGTPGEIGEVGAALGGGIVDVPPAELRPLLHGAMLAVAEPEALATGLLGDPVRLTEAATTLRSAVDAGDAPPLARRVLRLRCKALQPDYLARFGGWEQLAAALAAVDTAAGSGGDRDRRVVVGALEHLVGLRTVLQGLEPGGATGDRLYGAWVTRLDALLEAALGTAEREAAELVARTGTGVDSRLVAALVGLRSHPDLGRSAERVLRAHSAAVNEELVKRWSVEEPPSSAETVAFVHAVASRIRETDELLDSEGRELLLADWLHGAAATELERRLVQQRNELTASMLSRLPGQELEAPLFAGKIARLLDAAELRRWQEGLTGPDRQVLDASEMRSDLDLLVGLPEGSRLRGVALDLRGASERLLTLRDVTGAQGIATRLAGFARDVRDLPVEDRGETLARILLAMREARPEGSVDNVVEWNVDHLWQALDDRAQRALRELYLEDLRAVWSAQSDLRAAMNAARADLVRLTEQRARIADQLRGFFGPEGLLERLEQDYRLDQGLEFKPEGAAGLGDEWRYDRFLLDVAALIRPHLDPAVAPPAELQLVLDPVDLDSDVWGRGYVFVRFDDGGEERPFDTADLGAAQEVGPLAWRFGAEGFDEFSLRWSRVSSFDVQDGNARLRIGSCLAPLVMAWVYGQERDVRDGRTSFPIEAPASVVGGAAEEVEFALRFQAAIPVRPVDPWGR